MKTTSEMTGEEHAITHLLMAVDALAGTMRIKQMDGMIEPGNMDGLMEATLQLASKFRSDALEFCPDDVRATVLGIVEP